MEVVFRSFTQVYTGRLANLGDTCSGPFFLPFVGLGIVRVIGDPLLLLDGLRLLFQNVPRIVWLDSELRGLLLILILDYNLLL